MLLAEDVREIDDMIFRREILSVIQCYCRKLPIGLKEAMDVYQWRFDFLVRTCPEKFEVRIEGYWNGFYS